MITLAATKVPLRCLQHRSREWRHQQHLKSAANKDFIKDYQYYNNKHEDNENVISAHYIYSSLS